MTLNTSTCLRSIARNLNKVLGPTLVATLAGSEEGLISEQWAEPDGPLPGQEAEARLRAAQDAWNIIVENECPQTVCNWFVGLNPFLDQPPVMALRDGRLDDVRGAAKAMADDTWQL